MLFKHSTHHAHSVRGETHGRDIRHAHSCRVDQYHFLTVVVSAVMSCLSTEKQQKSLTLESLAVRTVKLRQTSIDAD